MRHKNLKHRPGYDIQDDALGDTVPLPPKARAAWLARGTLVPVHPHLGDALPRLTEPALHAPRTGLRLGDLDRVAEDTLIR